MIAIVKPIQHAVALGGVGRSMLSEAQLELSASADHEIRRVGVTVSAIGVANPAIFLEFARERREAGRPIAEAARLGAEQRFRAVLMTVLSFIFGIVPLACRPVPGPARARPWA